MKTNKLEQCIRQRILDVDYYTCFGKVVDVSPYRVRARIPLVALGDHVRISLESGGSILGKICHLIDDICEIKCNSDCSGIFNGAQVRKIPPPEISLGSKLLGQCIDGYGNEISRFASASRELQHFPTASVTLEKQASPYETLLPNAPLCTKVAAIDVFTTLAYGQGIGLIAPPGIGKTSLLQQLLKGTQVEVTIIVLVGERAREITHCVETIRNSAKAKTTTIIATPSSSQADEKINAAQLAISLAEYFRQAGLNVLLVFDSLTRLARAWRDQALASGQLPARHGYPVSVFEKLPQLLERNGRVGNASITSIYTLLANEDVVEDPLIEESCSVLDGHIYLSSDLAALGVYPALDTSRSISRLQTSVLESRELSMIAQLRAIVSKYQQSADLLKLSSNTNAADALLENQHNKIIDFLKNPPAYSSFEELFSKLERIMIELEPS